MLSNQPTSASHSYASCFYQACMIVFLDIYLHPDLNIWPVTAIIGTKSTTSRQSMPLLNYRLDETRTLFVILSIRTGNTI